MILFLGANWGAYFDVVKMNIPVGPVWCEEICVKDIDKANAMTRVLKHFGGACENVIAIGDSDNDRKMLQVAQIGVAMGNSVPGLKKVADYITDDVTKNGIWNFFEKIGMLNEY